MRTQRKIQIVLAAAAIAASGCDSGGHSAGGTPTETIVIRVATPELSLSPGERGQVVATVQGAAGSTLAWSTSDPAVATVDAAGTVTALAPGDAVVTVKLGGAAGFSNVRVKPKLVARVASLPDAATLHFIDDSVRLSGTAYDAAGAPLSGGSIGWSTPDTAIVSVAANGKVVARGTGLARVVAASSGKADTSMIQVVQVVAALVVSPAAQTLTVGQSAPLQAAARDSGGAAVPGVAVAWTSSDGAVAAVDAGGTVRGVAAGSATLVASARGVSASGRVEVKPARVDSLAISPASFTLTPGQNAQATAVAKDAAGAVLTGRAVTWSSSNPAVANVSPVGVVWALAAGSATIYATSEGKTATAPVTVQPAPIASLALTPASFSLTQGQTATATAVAKDASGAVLTGRAVSWSSSNPAVATVSSGTITAVGAGSATITATSEGKSAAAAVTVAGTGTGGGGTPTVLASHDFDNGLLTPFRYPWTQYPNDLTVVDDPTGSGRGKLVRLHYVRDDLSQGYDRNRGLQYQKTDGIGLGQSIFFRGELYLGKPLSGSESGQRKLLYWQPDGTNKFPEFFTILGLYGYSMYIQTGYPGAGLVQATGLATLQPARWYRVEMQVTMNTSFTANDGIARVWLDGALVYEKTNARWSNPTWTASPADQKFRYFLVGDQVNYNGLYDEDRLWDNITFSTARLP